MGLHAHQNYRIINFQEIGANPATQNQIQSMPLDLLEILGEALFDFSSTSDLITWIEGQP